MSTIALVLHDPAASRVREIWSMLEERFGLVGIHKVPFPHLTLMGFEGLSHFEVKELLERVSQHTAPFTLESSGLGLFNEPAKILFAPVVKTPGLQALHRVLCEELRHLGGSVPAFSTPGKWVPHVTLAQGEPARGSYGEAVDLLMGMDLKLSFEVRNLTLFDWVGPRYEPCDRFPLMGREAKA
jgi:2'-5' RNA ligase